MNKEITSTEQSLHLATVYQKINDEGRNMLEMLILKLMENKWKPEEIKHPCN
jgi:DNA-binding LacI/PurR family transcriptional regulator